MPRSVLKSCHMNLLLRDGPRFVDDSVLDVFESKKTFVTTRVNEKGRGYLIDDDTLEVLRVVFEYTSSSCTSKRRYTGNNHICSHIRYAFSLINRHPLLANVSMKIS